MIFLRLKMFLVLVLAGYYSFAQIDSSAGRIPKEYFRTVINNLRSDYYFVDRIDLDAIIREVLPLVENSRGSNGAYPAIRELLNRLYEKHSGFLEPAEASKLFYDTAAIVYPSVEFLKDSVGYIRIPAYTFPESGMQQWADTVVMGIAAVNKKVRGWIIDLRGNYGGSHLPMLAAIAPLLGEGSIFSERNREGEIVYSHIASGEFIQEKNNKPIYWFPSGLPAAYPRCRLPVAVLIDSITASGGEITALALRQCPNARFFGEATTGYPTLSKVFLMPDKAILYLVNRVIIDQSGRERVGKIEPDVYITPQKNEMDDPCINAARKWISRRR